MESRTYKEDLRDLILDMAHKNLENYISQKGAPKAAQKFFEANVDRIIDENIQKIKKKNNKEKVYLKLLTYGSYQDNIATIAKMIRKEELFKNKREIYDFARYLNLNVNKRSSYNQVIKNISKYIYNNRNTYRNKYVIYKRANSEYILNPKDIEGELIENYKSKARDEMKSIAKLLDVEVDDEEGAEDIRKKIINNIIKVKLRKNK